MSVLGWILFGFVVGLLARAILPGRDPLGVIGTTSLGIAGALIAGWLGQAAGWYGPDEGAGFVSATVGAIIMLVVGHWVAKKSVTRKGSGSGGSRFDKAA
jgi:uncharacterized membrane protein YeaQ/YmgE (transglycosylase-associated protein family)